MRLRNTIGLVLATSIFLLLQPSLAKPPVDDVSRISSEGWRNYFWQAPLSFPWPWKAQFRDWYGSYAHGLRHTSTVTCGPILEYYDSFYNAPQDSANASRLLAACDAQLRCILDNFPADILASFSTASVFLGLIPTLLSQIGPSVAETALLSTKRPLLSFLISLNAPVLFLPRVLEYDDPEQALHGGLYRLRKIPQPWDRTISLVQYILLLGGAANVYFAVVDLGNKTVLAWSCTLNWAPLLWAFFPAIIHITAASSYASAKVLAERQRAKDSSGQRIASAEVSPPDPTTTPVWSRIRDTLRSEYTICANQHSSRRIGIKEKPRPVPVFLNVLTGIMAFIHVAFGTLVFSCLQFLDSIDALIHVVLPFLASTAIGRLTLIFEMAGLRAAYDEQNPREEEMQSGNDSERRESKPRRDT